MAVNVIAIVSILLVGPVLGVLDHTPARLELQVSPTVELQSYHGKTQKYTIPIDDITEVQVYSSLPEAGRIHGLDLEHYWQVLLSWYTTAPCISASTPPPGSSSGWRRKTHFLVHRRDGRKD
mgnify:CR=1 FL=1